MDVKAIMEILAAAPELGKIWERVSKIHGFIHKKTEAEINGIRGFLVWDFVVYNEITFDDTKGQICICGISVQTTMNMSADEIISTFGEPDVYEPDVYYDGDRIEYESDQLCFIMSEDGSVFCLDAPAEKFTLNDQCLNLYFDDLVSILGDDYYSLGGSGYQWSIGDLSYTFHISSEDYIGDIIEVSKFNTDDPIDNDAYLGDEGNYGTYGNLDSALVGRWRSFDGGTLQFDDNGMISSCDFNCWSLVGDTPDRVYWEADNGRVTCSAYFDEDVTYKIAGPSSGSEIEYITFSSNSRHRYERASGENGDGIIGKWVSVENSIWSYQFNADGTGLDNGTRPITWQAYTTDDGANAVRYNLLDSTYFDYTVEGDSLVVFLSDSSRVYTKVGN